MRARTILLGLVVVMGFALLAEPAGAQVITAVQRRNPDGNSGDTQAALGGLLNEGSPCFSDRTHVYKNIPPELAGIAEYVITCNDDKDNPNHELDVTLSAKADVYLIIDFRIGDGDNTNPPVLTSVMTWVTEMGFVDTGLKIDIDESNDGDIDNYGEVYVARFEPGTITFKEQNNGGNRNMYGVAAILVDPTYNPPPTVDIEPDFQQVFPGGTAALSVTVTDKDPEEGPAGVLSWTWSATGPGTATFDPSADTTTDVTASFDAPGIYTVQVEATDGDKSTTDQVIVRVLSAEDLDLLAYWPLDEIVDANVVPDVAMGNDGILLDEPAEPNLVPGWIGTGALEFYGADAAYVEVQDQAGEPNLITDLRYGITVSAWINTTEFTNSWAAIAARGENTWRLGREGGTSNLAFHVNTDAGQASTNGNRVVNDGVWHHVVGVYSPTAGQLYIDGVLDAEIAGLGLINMNPDSPATIGARAGRLDRAWNGQIDEVKIFNFAMTADQVRGLSGAGALPPIVSIVPFDAPVKYKPGDVVQLDGNVEDYGAGGLDDVTILWTTVTGPAEGVEATFTDPTDPDTTVGFPEYGTYTLQLTAVDGGVNVQASAQVAVTVVSPDCSDVAAEGLLLIGDINADCRVNLEDFALLAADWMRCNNPADSNCEWPFEEEE